jgi:hypothetical protein
LNAPMRSAGRGAFSFLESSSSARLKRNRFQRNL